MAGSTFSPAPELLTQGVVNTTHMSQRVKKGGESTEDPDSRLLYCTECGNFQPAIRNNDGDLKPLGGAIGGRCPNCGEDAFEPVVFDPEGN